MKLYFKKIGQGAPILLLHGVFGSSDNLTGVAKSLSESFCVYLIDQRNHGHSPHSQEFNYNLLTQDLLEFIESHQLDQPTVVGHSMGGKVAMNFALKHGDKLSKLVVVDIAPRYYPLHHQNILEALSCEISAFSSRSEVEQLLIPFLPEYSTRQFIMKNLYRKEGGGFGWRIHVESLKANIAEVGALIDSAQSFDKPVLVVKGEKSGYIKTEDLIDFQRLFPKYRLREVPAAGHWVHAESPQGFLDAVMPFLIGQNG
jgi:pimeloyl-ACP methyl ester carboxylesterase